MFLRGYFVFFVWTKVDDLISLDKVIGAFVIGMLLGLIFLIQGFGKIFTWGIENVVNADFFHGTFKDVLSDYIIYITAYQNSTLDKLRFSFLIKNFFDPLSFNSFITK